MTQPPLRSAQADRYAGEQLNRVAFPLGGLGAGMFCLEGTGALSHFSLRHAPDLHHRPLVFAAICVKGQANGARVLEGPVQDWKIFGGPNSGLGALWTTYGLPRFARAEFAARFPFAGVSLVDETMPVEVTLTGWSPFEPGLADDSSLPVAAIEYRFRNRSAQPVEAVFSFHAGNFMGVEKNPRSVQAAPGGFILHGAGTTEKPWDEGAFSATVSDPECRVNHAWFRGGFWDPLTDVWRTVSEGRAEERPPVGTERPSHGGSLAVPIMLQPGEDRTIVLRFAWHVPHSNLRFGGDPAATHPGAPEYYRPWYAARFSDIHAVTVHWRDRYVALRAGSRRFSDCLHDSTLAPEVINAVAANLTILKSPTVLRQADGRIWAWEGCGDKAGSCAGTCTHVWNYAQATAHLFPELERRLRETEHGPCQDERGQQMFRTPLPIRPAIHDFHPAADGQLGGVMKVYRDWRISGDTAWLRTLWPAVRRSLDYCIATWDPERRGWLEEPHHNTYDIEFWGPDSMCTSFYAGALQAAVRICQALDEPAEPYAEVLARARQRLENDLFDGDYFFQKVVWQDRRAGSPLEITGLPGKYSPEAEALLAKEGPRYQYGPGCLSDGVIGEWFAAVCGVGSVIDAEKVRSHLLSVFRHNFRRNLRYHANPQRPGYACRDEGGLLLCSWPKGGRPTLPLVYADEVWTGIEYQVASHLIMIGEVEKGLEIVRTLRARYDGRVRNPFDEYECGHWYARALSSYGLLQALSGARYDAVDRVLHLSPKISGDFRCFLSTASGYGTVGVRAGKPFLDIKAGLIDVREIRYQPAPAFSS